MKNNMIRSAAAMFIVAIIFSSLVTGCSGSGTKAKADYEGVQIGVITYSWRSMPGTAEDIIKYCKQTRISSIELMGKFRGIERGGTQ